MRAFARLYNELDTTNSTSQKLQILVDYLSHGDTKSLAYAIYFLSGRKLRGLPSNKLKDVCKQITGISDWLFQESYDNVGDLAETIALLLPGGAGAINETLAEFVEQNIIPLKDLDDAALLTKLSGLYSVMDINQKFVFNKLITGGFRVGVSHQLVAKALARVSGVSENIMQHRLMGDWAPDSGFYERLICPDHGEGEISAPYPFYLASPISVLTDCPDDASMGSASDFAFEWKWDGIRAQVIKRQGQVFIWSRGEELVTDRFPEVARAASKLPDGTVLDGELLAFKEGDILPFAQLQKRIGRKTLSKKLLADVPVAFICFDILEADSVDIREQTYINRRHKMLSILTPGALGQYPSCAGALSEYLRVPPLIAVSDWQEARALRATSRDLKVEGLMLKRQDSVYGVGRKRGDWWKWKVDPHSIDAVLIYAQRGHGRRASLYTDYTFGLWHGGELVPVAKAYSGLTDLEIKEVDSYIRANTKEKFGPVRTVTPGLVFELSFEGIQLSPRHKSGVAVRFPRISRWRTDKTIEQADHLDTLKEMIEQSPLAVVPGDG